MAERSDPLAELAFASPDCLAAQLTALPPARRHVVHGDAASLGMALPDSCRVIVDRDRVVLWLGPGEFLLFASDCDSPGAIDISHRDTAIEVSGPRAAWVINAFCALDLDVSAFPVGMCTRTVFGKAQILLWRTAADTFRIEVARSFAPYVWGCLEEARREFLD
jgi:heterotetrameric sarcosine oxidase gamma subunit